MAASTIRAVERLEANIALADEWLQKFGAVKAGTGAVAPAAARTARATGMPRDTKNWIITLMRMRLKCKDGQKVSTKQLLAKWEADFAAQKPYAVQIHELANKIPKEEYDV